MAGQNKLDVYYPQFEGAGGQVDLNKVVDAINRIYDFYYRAVPVDPDAINSTIITDGFVDQLLMKLHLTSIFLTHETFFASTAVCAWNDHQLNYKDKQYSIPAGTTTHAYIYWSLTAPSSYQTSTTLPTLGENDYLIATYDATAGKVKEVWQSRFSATLPGIQDDGVNVTISEPLRMTHKLILYNGVAPMNGHLLIGNTGTATFDENPLSAGTGVNVTPGAGSITIALVVPVAVLNGGTGSTTAAGARANLGAALAGAPTAHTVTLAALTGGGTQGSISWNADGCVTAFVDPT